MELDSYKAYAPWYDLFVKPLTQQLRRKALQLWEARAHMSILEVGCGTGLNLKYLLHHSDTYFGLDLSASMLSVAQRQFGNAANLARADAAYLPFPKDRFDYIIISFVLHEISPKIRSAVMAECTRVLKQSGRIMVIDYHPQTARSFWGWLLERGIGLVERLAGFRHYRHYCHFRASNGLPSLLNPHTLALERLQLALKDRIGIYVLKKPCTHDLT
jgi:ubiquinone/menaquinone biosynthesis C-methylase UbiE